MKMRACNRISIGLFYLMMLILMFSTNGFAQLDSLVDTVAGKQEMEFQESVEEQAVGDIQTLRQFIIDSLQLVHEESFQQQQDSIATLYNNQIADSLNQISDEKAALEYTVQLLDSTIRSLRDSLMILGDQSRVLEDIGAGYDLILEAKYFNYEKLATQHFTAKEASLIAKEYIYSQLGFKRPLLIENHVGIQGTITIDKDENIESFWTFALLDFAGGNTWYSYLIEINEEGVFDFRDQIYENFFNDDLESCYDLDAYWRNSDEVLLDFKTYFENTEIGNHESLSVDFNMITENMGQDWDWYLMLWVDNNDHNNTGAVTGANRNIEPHEIYKNEDWLSDNPAPP